MTADPRRKSKPRVQAPVAWGAEEREGALGPYLGVNSYSWFAEIYDVFGSEEFCLELALLLLEAARRYQLEPGTEVLDVACGTGVITIELARAGYRVTGLDLSPHMLARARRRAEKAGLSVQFLNLDMRDFSLPSRFPWVTCTHDSLDHLYLPEDLELAFGRLAAALEPGGYLMFDMNCWEGIRHLNGKTVFVETEDRSGAYYLVAEDRTLRTTIVGFLRRTGNLYERFDETLLQRCYSDQDILRILEACDLELLEKMAVQHLEGDIFKQLWICRRAVPTGWI